MPYSEIVLDHFHSPRNGYRMKDPDLVGLAGNPERGPFMLLYLKIEDEKIKDASYQTYGCGPAIAAGSLLTEKVKGSTRSDSAVWTEPAINDALGGLPIEKRHCSALAAKALVNALEQWPKPKEAAS
jgi:NifU-like protein involved in Fe-S cluster formation